MSDPDDPMNVHDYDVDQLRELLIIERRNYRELSAAHEQRVGRINELLKRVDDLREEKLLVEDRYRSLEAKLDTVQRLAEHNRKKGRAFLERVFPMLKVSLDRPDWADRFCAELQKALDAEARVPELCKKIADLETACVNRTNEIDALREEVRRVPDDADLQMICLALAELALQRPGFDYAIGEVAHGLAGDHGVQLVNAFKVTSKDLIGKGYLNKE